MHVLVFGAGAVGQAVGGLLAEAGSEVTMVLRPGPARAIAREGLRITGIFGDHHVSPGRLGLVTDGNQLRSAGEGSPIVPDFDFVLLTVKSYDTSSAVEQLRRIDDGRLVVASMQNGYGNVEKLVDAFGPDRALCGRVITGFVAERPGVVRITVHADAVTVGRLDGAESPHAERLADALTASGLPARASRRVHGELWAKILYNCALNAFGAILGVTYGQLADCPHTRELMDRIIDEAYAVLAAQNLPRMFATAGGFRRAFYGRMVPSTAAHAPSMLQDLRGGKRTEIDALNGAVVGLGAAAGIDAPVNRTVTAMVKFLEAAGSAGGRSAMDEES